MNTLYPLLIDEKQIPDILREIIRLRNDDVDEWSNLPQRFVLGRGRYTTRSIPTSSTDVLPTDREGDIVNNNSNIYTLLNIGGVLKWDRRSLTTNWS